MTQTVELWQMLDARERRSARQQTLLRQYGKPLLCFTMNIAGPVKNSLLIRRGFQLGNTLLTRQLASAKLSHLHFSQWEETTGNEGYYVVDADPYTLKRLAVEVEDSCPLGRLFDMDVWMPDGQQVSRRALGLPERPCLICGSAAKGCARSRTHTVVELQQKTTAVLQQAVDEADAQTVAQYATQALLYEVCTTPKPGLVDRANSGSHRDMDIFTFMASAAALTPYFAQCTRLGQQTAAQPAPQTLAALRTPGKQAEGLMLAVTHGVNTHKGAIFSIGIACAALGRLPQEQWSNSDAVLDECAALCAGITTADFSGVTMENAATTGQKLYAQYGITGVRGQAEAGFPAVRQAGLPTLRRCLNNGHTINEAGCAALLALMAAATDTNLIARSDLPTQQAAAAQAAALLKRYPCPDAAILAEFDHAFIEKNLSPGGSADLLALCYLLHFLQEEDAYNE